MLVPKVIIEGSNLSGKTSIAQELERRFVHSVVVTLHGYYHPKFLENIKTVDSAIKYHRRRLQSFLPAFNGVSAEELIFNRFHLTASVYLKLFYGIEEPFHDIEQKLNELGVYVVLIDFDDYSLEQRLKERLTSGKESPWGDEGLTKARGKRNLYRYFFKISSLKKKLLIDNSNSKRTIELTVNEIIKKINQ